MTLHEIHHTRNLDEILGDLYCKGESEGDCIIEDELSLALSRIHELEEELEDAHDIIRRFIEGNPVEWEA